MRQRGALALALEGDKPALPPRIVRRRREARRVRSYGEAGLQDELHKMEAAPRGGRHKAVYVAARHVGRLVGGGELDSAYAKMRLLAVARTVLHDDPSEAYRHVANGLKDGLLDPPSVRQDGPQRIKARSDAIAEAVRWRDAALACAPSGRIRNPYCRIVTAFSEAAIVAGKVDVSESHRQVAERAGCSRDSLRRVLPLLIGRWLIVVARGSRRTGQTATVWRLNLVAVDWEHPDTIPEALPTGPAGWCLGAQVKPVIDHPAHNVWSAYPGCWTVWQCTPTPEDQPASTAEIARCAGLHPSTTRRHLVRLQASPLVMVERGEDGRTATWRRLPLSAGEAVELDEMFPDRRAARAERHAEDRQAFRANIARRRLAELRDVRDRHGVVRDLVTGEILDHGQADADRPETVFLPGQGHA